MAGHAWSYDDQYRTNVPPHSNGASQPLPFSSPLPYKRELYAEFLLELKRSTRQATSLDDRGNIIWKGDTFVHYDGLKTWALSPRPGKRPKNIDYLRDMVYREADWSSHTPDPIISETIKKSCLRTFFILLELRIGHLIHEFHDFDKMLPLDLASLQSQFIDKFEQKVLKTSYGHMDTGHISQSDACSIAEQFNALQWKYCPANFMSHRPADFKWPDSQVFPYMAYNMISDKGGTAKVYEVAIPLSLVDPKWRAAKRRKEIEGIECGQFAIKVFPLENQRIFVDERNAFMVLSDNQGMIGYLGAFSQVVNKQFQHVILLEYADIDLEEFFFRSPPWLPDQILQFWKNLAPVITTLKNLHEFDWCKLEKPERYKGWHADIKPDNILLVDNEFKLADPGFANFEAQQEREKKMRNADHQFRGGTTTYGAPERYNPSSKVGSPCSSDIWSIGCVLSEAVTWIVFGHLGIKQFRDTRRTAIEWLKTQSGHTLTQGPKRKETSADFFHDGTNVLQAVKQWHRLLRISIRPHDYLSESILDFVDKHLLCGKQDDRITAKKAEEWFLQEITRVEQLVQQQLQTDDYPSIVTETLRKVIDHAREQEALELQEMIDRQSSTQRKIAKSHMSYLQVPNAEVLTDNSRPRDRRPSLADITDQGLPRTRTASKTQSPVMSEARLSSTTTIETPMLDHSATVTPTTSDSQYDPDRESLFQTYYRLVEREKTFLGKLVVGKTQLPREWRLDHLITNRDLVFLIDNGYCMMEHWWDATFVMEMLWHKMSKYDTNGMDLFFTTGSQKAEDMKGAKALKRFRKLMTEEKEGAQPAKNAHTVMETCLGLHLNSWLAAYNSALKRNEEPRAKTIYVLTDGRWEGSSKENPRAVDDTIVEFYNKLKALATKSILLKRLLTIQFISFGKDPVALERLRRLDNDLKYRGVADIVDTEPALGGDTFQMILGSIDELQDGKNDQVQSPPLQPSSPERVNSPTRLARQPSTRSRMSSAISQFGNSLQPQNGYLMPRRLSGGPIPQIQESYHD